MMSRHAFNSLRQLHDEDSYEDNSEVYFRNCNRFHRHLFSVKTTCHYRLMLQFITFGRSSR